MVGISLDETTTLADVKAIADVFSKAVEGVLVNPSDQISAVIPSALVRSSNFMSHPVFNIYHSEHEMLRYIKSLEAKDLSL